MEQLISPLDVWQRVWIVPQSAGVYEDKTSGMVLVRSARLKVMLEGGAAGMAQEVMLTQVIPLLQERVDTGAEFIPLRRIYSALILAAWYKQRMTTGRLHQEYVDRGKVTGIAIDDPGLAERIWQQYARTFEQGAFDLLREERDIPTGEVVVRRYFSGGMNFDMAQLALRKEGAPDQSELERLVNDAAVLDVILQPIKAMPEQGADSSMATHQSGQPVVAGYAVLRLLQDKGRFAVYLAEKDGKKYILKTPSTKSDRQSSLAQLQANEARILKDITMKYSASGRDGAVVRFVEYFHDQERSYLVTEYIDGQTFGEYFYAHADMGLTARLRLLRALLIAVGEVHQAGYVSCDIKPDNIMIDSRGRVRVIDLDMAVGLGSLRTSEDLVTGVPMYVPPEDSPGAVKVPERWNAVRDIYALGMLLMQTAMSPLQEGQRGSVPVFRLWLDTRVETRDREDVFLRIRAMVRKALAEKPQQRYQSTSEMTADLERLLQLVSRNWRMDKGGVDLAGIERRLDIVRAAEDFNTSSDFLPEAYQESAGYFPLLLQILPLQNFVEPPQHQP
jgi:serine/threonine protein kinase